MTHAIRRAALATLLLAAPAHAGVDAAITDHILPGFTEFSNAANALSDVAAQDCTAQAVAPAYQEAFDAWMGISHLTFGPLEDQGRALAIAFWPDKRGMVRSTVARLVAEQDAATATAEDFAEVSVAGRGLFALEYLLFDPDFAGYVAGNYSCELVQAVSADLARMAAETRADWSGYATTLQTAGEAGNTTYLTEKEAAQELFTALVTGLEWTADQRLGRPMGSFDRPRPERAEARRSGRSLRNVILSVEALEDLARSLANGPIPETEAAFATALDLARDLDDPVLAGVADPAGRLKVEILQQHIKTAKTNAAAEIGPQFGVAAGFNATDGD